MSFPRVLDEISKWSNHRFMSITKEQKDDIRQRKAVLNPLQASLQEIYHYFHTVHGTQPSHKDVVKLLAELAESQTKVGQGGH